MRVLIVAPQPFFEERGTPIAVRLLAEALVARGDSVDVLTVHLGGPIDSDEIGILRVRPWFAPSRMPPGFSAAKLYCDVLIGVRTLMLARRSRYDVVHAIEESSFMAMTSRAIGGSPYVCDIDSSMTTQLVDRFSILRPLRRMLEWLEALPLRWALGSAVVCEALAGPARRYCRGPTMLLPDVSLVSGDRPDVVDEQVDDLRSIVRDDRRIILYVGNLESYQGIDLLLDAFARYDQHSLPASLVIIGGSTAHIAHYRSRAESLDIGDVVHLVGPRPVALLEHYLRQADVLVSPRTQGVNTPMKVYSYLDSGRPLVATDLPTHTQVMGPEHAELAAPDPDAFAAALSRVLNDSKHATTLVGNARELIAINHSPESFRRRVFEFYGSLDQRLADRS